MAVILNTLQEKIFAIIAKNETIWHDFYFTGGTALSECYLHHRESVDLDFFSERPFQRKLVDDIVASLHTSGIQTSQVYKIHDRYTFDAIGDDSTVCKLDFCHYGFLRLERTGKKFMGIEIDSIRDILTNKWCTIFDRNEPKDILDIACLTRKWYMHTDDRTLMDIAADLAKKFTLKVGLDAMKQQYVDRLQSSGAEKMRSILYIDIGVLNIFPKDQSTTDQWC